MRLMLNESTASYMDQKNLQNIQNTHNIQIKNFIDGKFIESLSSDASNLPFFDPAIGQNIGVLPDSDGRDIEAAVVACENSFSKWKKVGACERGKFLRKIAHSLSKRAEGLSYSETINTGKPITLSQSVDIARSIANFEFFADAATQFSSEFHQTDELALNYTLRAPIGTVGCISPWNLPLYLLSWKIAPALASGNCVIAKPSEITPLTAYYLSEIFKEVDLPQGVVNIVHGTGVKSGSAISEHPKIRAISFTGSTLTGSQIAQRCASHFKKLSLEMGGKNATVVFEDCNFEQTVPEVVRAAFTNQGQVCFCGSRVLVQNTIYDKFKQLLLEHTRTLRCGDPLDPTTTFGAMTSLAHFQKVMKFLDLAKKLGGGFLCGGNRFQPNQRCQNGWFIEPTWIEGLKMDSEINQEEIFGPVATLTPFESEKDAIHLVNQTKYGLAASIWTENLNRAHRVAAAIHTGMVWINCWMLRDLRTPFGGVKQSGSGREGGWEAMRFYTEPKNICVKLGMPS